MDDSPGASTDAAAWRQAVAAVRSSLAAKSRFILGLQVVIVFACYSATTIAGGYSWAWVVIMTALVPALLIIGQSTSRRLNTRARDQAAAGNPLRDVHLPGKILAGEITGNELHAHTPWLFSWLVPPRRDPDRTTTLRRVVFAIEWYCGPRQRFLPQLWVCLAALLVILASVATLVIVFRPGLNYILEHLWLGIFLLSFINLADPELETIDLLESEFARLKWQAPTMNTRQILEEQGPDRILSAINLLDQNTGRIRFCFLRPCSLLPMLTCAILMFASAPLFKPYLLVAIPLMMLMCTSSPIFIQWLARNGGAAGNYRRAVRRSLADSDLPVRIVRGEVPELIDGLNVPRLFAPLLKLPPPPRGCANQLVDDIWQASNNLDWILDPPIRAVRAWWRLLFVQLGGLVAAVAGAAFAYRHNHGPGSVLDLDLTVCIGALALVFACAVPGWVHDGRMIIWREELLDELRRDLRE